MTMKTLLTTAAALALIGGAAHAGEGAKKSKPADPAQMHGQMHDQMRDETGKAMTPPGADASAVRAGLGRRASVLSADRPDCALGWG